MKKLHLGHADQRYVTINSQEALDQHHQTMGYLLSQAGGDLEDLLRAAVETDKSINTALRQSGFKDLEDLFAAGWSIRYDWDTDEYKPFRRARPK